MTLKVISQGHSPVAGLFKCNPSNIYAVFYQILTDSASRGPSATAGLLVMYVVMLPVTMLGHCNTLCTSGFVDDDMLFSTSGKGAISVAQYHTARFPTMGCVTHFNIRAESNVYDCLITCCAVSPALC